MFRDERRRVVIAIDDFHFIDDVAARRRIVVALRTLTDQGCSAILSTVNSAESDPAFDNTNAGGRRKIVRVPKWDLPVLEKIGVQGFQALNLWAAPDLISSLASQSFGSPQIMQQLCLDLCEIENEIFERDETEEQLEVTLTSDEAAFFSGLHDDEASGWLAKLTAGPNPRRGRNKWTHPGPPPRRFDGYQLIMFALHEMGSPTEKTVSEVKAFIGQRLGLSGEALKKIAVEQKVWHIDLLGRANTKEALDQLREEADEPESDDETAAEEELFANLIVLDAIPQPVFDTRIEGGQKVMHVLDPLLSYMIKWHPEVIVASGR